MAGILFSVDVSTSPDQHKYIPKLLSKGCEIGKKIGKKVESSLVMDLIANNGNLKIFNIKNWQEIKTKLK
ncbi:hypothetical protein [Adhaeribacter aquaticus]|uniref:hypothetical protein n=1 Tax=Adhaeribacter aquaticus TaxID=299567 RepID=UPI0003FB99BF|nr:hypothetical protein [Adhaeribacter aquaticus]